MRWTILNNFLVGNTILLVAWSTLFVALVEGVHSVGLNIVLIGFCGVGIAGSVVWGLPGIAGQSIRRNILRRWSGAGRARCLT
jgi:hypothetical protein